MSKPDFSAEDLRQWRKDPRGEFFWDEVEELFKYHIELVRAAVRSGKVTEATIAEGYAMCAKDILTLTEKIIDEHKKEE